MSSDATNDAGFPSHLPSIETSRLLLRPFTHTDWLGLRRLDEDLDLQRYRWGNSISEAQTRDCVDRFCALEGDPSRTRFPFAIILRQPEGFAGACGLNLTNLPFREAEAWYELRRDLWGGGYTTEAVRALLQFGFAGMGLHRVWAACHPDNVGSRRVMEKSGMTYEGRLRESFLTGGVWRDSLIYAILSREWPPPQKSLP